MARHDLPPGLAGLKSRLRDHLTARHLSDAAFGDLAGLSDATIRRLWQRAGYRGTADTWRAVARAAGWSEADVLAQAGFEAAPVPEACGWALIQQGLTQYGVSEARQQAWRTLLDLERGSPMPGHRGHPRSDGS